LILKLLDLALGAATDPKQTFSPAGGSYSTRTGDGFAGKPFRGDPLSASWNTHQAMAKSCPRFEPAETTARHTIQICANCYPKNKGPRYSESSGVTVEFFFSYVGKDVG
jgi:hypothetical protein